jgi:hypothetical protein
MTNCKSDSFVGYFAAEAQINPRSSPPTATYALSVILQETRGNQIPGSLIYFSPLKFQSTQDACSITVN